MRSLGEPSLETRRVLLILNYAANVTQNRHPNYKNILNTQYIEQFQSSRKAPKPIALQLKNLLEEINLTNILIKQIKYSPQQKLPP